MIIGVLGLYIMMRSTSKLRELRKNVVRVLREQRERKFDLDDYRNMPGAGGYL